MTSLRDRIRQQVPAHAGAGGLAGAGLAALDQLPAATTRPDVVLLAWGVGAIAGTVGGLGIGTLSALLGRIGARARAAAFGAFGAAAGLGIAAREPVLARLVGPHATLAVVTLGLLLLAGTAVGLAVAWTVPTGPGQRFGPTRHRTVLLVGLLIGVALALGVDRAPALSGHPTARLALRGSGVGLGALALLWAWPAGRPPRTALVLALAVPTAGAAAACAAVTDAARLELLGARPVSAYALRVARRLTDIDGDDHSGWFGGRDCAPFDPRVHPRARELPGNGVDDNCLGGDGRHGTPTDFSLPPPPPNPSPVDVVLVTVDSLRPDHLGTYGAARRPTPALDAWSAGATRFDRSWACAGWTSMTLPALMRGVYARRLAWSLVFETNDLRLLPTREALRPTDAGWIAKAFAVPRADPHPTLPAMLARRGMATAAVVDDGDSEFLARELELAPGFGVYRETDELTPNRRDDAGTMDTALAELDRLAAAGPFFLWVHLFGPHFPDTSHPGHPTFGDGRHMNDGYDHELAFMDAQLARLFDRIAALEAERARPIAVLVTADHGEDILPDVRGHGGDLHEDTLRVPLFVRAPDLAPGPVLAPTNTVDLVPTILALTQTPIPAWVDGVDLRTVTGAEAPERILLSELWRFDAWGRPVFDQIAAYDGRHKLVFDQLAQTILLVAQDDRARPPTNLIGTQDPGPWLDRIVAFLDEAGDGITFRER
jgi:hypothetical protein